MEEASTPRAGVVAAGPRPANSSRLMSSACSSYYTVPRKGRSSQWYLPRQELCRRSGVLSLVSLVTSHKGGVICRLTVLPGSDNGSRGQDPEGVDGERDCIVSSTVDVDGEERSECDDGRECVAARTRTLFSRSSFIGYRVRHPTMRGIQKGQSLLYLKPSVCASKL